MKGPIGQLQLGFGKTVFNYEEVPPTPPEDQFNVKIINPQDLDVVVYDSASQKWVNSTRLILTDGGNF